MKVSAVISETRRVPLVVARRHSVSFGRLSAVREALVVRAFRRPAYWGGTSTVMDWLARAMPPNMPCTRLWYHF